MTRIVAGTRGGRRLVAPDGRSTRPTSDRVREALFSSLETLVDLVECRFLDLYAGSGAVGLEAASRGAAAVVLVDDDPKAIRAVRSNVSTLGLAEVCRVVPAKVMTALATGPESGFDVVFADPPYAAGDAEITAVLAALVEHGWLAAEAVVVVERSSRSAEPSWPAEIVQVRSRRYGETILWYGRRA